MLARMRLVLETPLAEPRTLAVEQARAELRELRASMLWAYAMGHGCSMGDHPEFRRVRRREQELMAAVREPVSPATP